MATVDSLRQDHLNNFLHREDASARPWTDDQLDAFIIQALEELWPTVAKFVSGDVPSDPTTNLYDVPESIIRVNRIDLIDATTGIYVDVVRSWRPVPTITWQPET